MGNFVVLLAAQIATVAFILWPIFRLLRKAGLERRRAWFLCVVCACCSFGMSGLNVFLSQADWFESLDLSSLPAGLLQLGVLQFVLSPFVACVVPVLYFTYGKWPLEGRRTEADIFG